MVRIGSGALLALVLAGCTPRPESTPMVNDEVPVVWTALREGDAKDLLVEAGARIEAEEQTDEHGWLITAKVPGGLPVTWKGMHCQGVGPDRACTEYKIEVALKSASPQAAQALAASRDILFPADAAVGDEYVVWRMGFTYGGVTRAYLKNTLAVTIDMGFAAAKEIEEAGKPEVLPAASSRQSLHPAFVGPSRGRLRCPGAAACTFGGW